jgi:hypothetical protein
MMNNPYSKFKLQNPEEDTTIGIWDDLYKVRIPVKFTYSVEYLKEYGLPSSGNKDIDKEQFNQRMTTFMSIDKMVEYYKQGCPIYIVDKDDTKKIYDAISKHLNAWKQQIDYGLNVGSAPFEDLITLDQFANVVYEHAKYQFIPETENHPLAQFLSQFHGLRFGGLKPVSTLPSVVDSHLQSGLNLLRDEKKEVYTPEDRFSMADLFKQSLDQYRR